MSQFFHTRSFTVRSTLRFPSILSCPLSRFHSLLGALIDAATSVTLDPLGTKASTVSCQAYFWKLLLWKVSFNVVEI